MKCNMNTVCLPSNGMVSVTAGAVSINIFVTINESHLIVVNWHGLAFLEGIGHTFIALSLTTPILYEMRHDGEVCGVCYPQCLTLGAH